MSPNAPKLALVPNAEEEGVKTEKTEPNLKPAPRELTNEERKEKERLELIQYVREDIKKLMAMSEDEVREKYNDLVSWDNDAKLYLGSRPLPGDPGDPKWYLCWPNYELVPMRATILKLFSEKLRKLEKRPFVL